MIWLAIVLLSAVTLLPCALLLGHRAATPQPRETALTLLRAQYEGLHREHADGLIAGTELEGARLEIQRRLLAETDRAEAIAARGEPASGAWLPILVLLCVIPLGAVGLYLIGGHPGLPGQPLARRLAQQEASGGEDARLIGLLQARLAALPAGSAQSRQGYLLLGEAQATRGAWTQAAAAFRRALEQGFDPTLAVQAAEAQVQAEHGVSEASAALFRKALDGAPQDAPWRLLAEQRVAQSEHH